MLNVETLYCVILCDDEIKSEMYVWSCANNAVMKRQCMHDIFSFKLDHKIQKPNYKIPKSRGRYMMRVLTRLKFTTKIFYVDRKKSLLGLILPDYL